MSKQLSRILVTVGIMLLAVGAVYAQGGGGVPDSAMLGGNLTVFDESEEAFTNEIAGLSEAEFALFEEGDDAFEREFGNDQIGPFYDARSCEACHLEDGRGQPPAETVATIGQNNDGQRGNDNRDGRGGDGQRGDGNGRGNRDGRPNGNNDGNRNRPAGDGEDDVTGFVVMLSSDVRDLHGYLPDPIYGGQFQAQSVRRVPEEGSFVIRYETINGQFADGTPYTLRNPIYGFENLNYGALGATTTFSPRVAPQIIGLGLLEAVPDSAILALADANDANGDGISGRPNYVWDVYNNRQAIGRFGWKANTPTLIQQAAGAYFNDMGLTTSLFSDPTCTDAQPVCADNPDGNQPEISDAELIATTFYTQTLAVPAQRDYDDPQVQFGAMVFEQAGCTSCHTPTLESGTHPTIPALSNQVFHPYTDLLIHDMGAELADGRPHGEATGSEWRTPPLWGIGLFETVNDHTYYLHDGRARNLTEAILWHGGEGQASRDYFLNLDAQSREALIAFLRSL